MKSLYAFVILSFFAISLAAQSYTITYKKEMRFEQPKNLMATIPSQYCIGTLIYANGESNYNESELQTSKLQANQTKTISAVTVGGGMVYKNALQNTILVHEDILGKKFVVSYAKPHWKFSKQTQQICGYTCKLVEYEDNGFHYKLWYTSKIPIPDGPSIYAGLPGLILKVEMENLTIIAASIKSNIANVKIHRLKKEKAISETEAKKLSRDRVSEFARSMGGKVKINKPN